MPRGRAGGRLGGGRRAGHGFGAHHHAGHGFGGHGFGGHGIGRSHFHNHHFHHSGNHLFNSRPRRHGGHLGHGVPTNFAIHMGTDENGVSTVTVTGDTGTGVTGSNRRSSNVAFILIFPMLGCMCFMTGGILGGVGSWGSSVLGIAGIVVMVLGAIFWGLLFLSVFCLSVNRPNPAKPAGQAGEPGADVPNPNIASEPTMTAQGEATNLSQGREIATFFIHTNGLQPGGTTMSPQSLGFNILSGLAAATTQPAQQPPQNFPGASNPPPGPSETLPYPPPQSNPATTDPMPNPEATAPPLNYPVAYPRAPTDGKVDVVEPARGKQDDIPPPPSYDDAVTGYGKHDECDGKT